MGYLQLAEPGKRSQRYSNRYHYLSQAAPEDLYVFIPNDETGMTGQWVREDAFDDLTDEQFDRAMDALLPFQPEDGMGLRILGIGKRSAAQQARYDRRQERKQAKFDAKLSKKQAKADLIKAKAEGKVPTFGQAISKGISGIFGGGGDEGDYRTLDVEGGVTYDGGVPSVDFSVGTEKKWYENPWIIGGAILLIGGTIIVLTKPKKKAPQIA